LTTAYRKFDKYDDRGAYHWEECDPTCKSFNPPLVARYEVLARQVRGANRILDIGSGDGYLTALLCRHGAFVTGVEQEPEAVALARTMLSSTPLSSVVRGSCYKLPIASSTCDAAALADVIEHLEQPGLALGEVARVLTPEGKLVLTTPKWRPDRIWDSHHVQEFKPDELMACLREHFEHVELRFFWPIRWSNFYSSKVGWRALKVYARHFSNPFVATGLDDRRFGQILAVCRAPKHPTKTPRASRRQVVSAAGAVGA